MPRRLALLCFLMIVFCFPAHAGQASDGLEESMHAVRLERGADLNFIVSKRTGTAPRIGVLLFAGYPGILRIRNEGGVLSYDLAGNFLIRARRFLNTAETFTVMVDCPTDQWTACDDRYRTSEQHAAAIVDVIRYLKKNSGAKQIYLVGTSYGTVSSAYLAKRLSNAIAGVVHTASFTDPKPSARFNGAVMRSFDWSQIKAPQLFVHHRDDPCEMTRYQSIVQRKQDAPLITVDGSVNPRGDACQAFTAHGFVGREQPVMQSIADWIAHRKLVAVIDGNQ